MISLYIFFNYTFFFLVNEIINHLKITFLVQNVYEEVINLMKLEGAALLTKEKKDLLEKTLWINGKLNREIIAKE